MISRGLFSSRCNHCVQWRPDHALLGDEHWGPELGGYPGQPQVEEKKLNFILLWLKASLEHRFYVDSNSGPFGFFSQWEKTTDAEGPGKTGTVFHTPSTPTSTSHTPPNRYSGSKHRSLSAGCVYTSTSSNVGATSKSAGGGLGCNPLGTLMCSPTWMISKPRHSGSLRRFHTLPGLKKPLAAGN